MKTITRMMMTAVLLVVALTASAQKLSKHSKKMRCLTFLHVPRW